MDWIADQYEMRMPSDYIKPEACSDQNYPAPASMNRIIGGSGNIEDINKDDCNAKFDYYNDKGMHVTLSKCAFNYTLEGTNQTTKAKCQLDGSEGFSYNIYQCEDKTGNLGTCANNCRGVNPNSILIGGVAPFFAFAAGLSFLTPALQGAAGLGAGVVGMGGMGVGPSIGGQCPNRRPCRVSEQMLVSLY